MIETIELKLVTLEEYLMGRDKIAPLTSDLRKNAEEMVKRVNELLSHFGEYRHVTSGYRPQVINKRIPNAAPRSNHMVCKACDLYDPNGDLDEWCVENLFILVQIGLWLESTKSTPGWCHVSITPPASGNRIFFV